MRLIDADAIPYTMLYKENWLAGTGMEKQGAWKDDIDALPTHDATTLMQENINMRKIIHERVKDGRWEKIGTFLDGETVRCCKCGETVILNKMNRERYNFCPNCGAKMMPELTIPEEIINSVLGEDD